MMFIRFQKTQQDAINFATDGTEQRQRESADSAVQGIRVAALPATTSYGRYGANSAAMLISATHQRLAGDDQCSGGAYGSSNTFSGPAN